MGRLAASGELAEIEAPELRFSDAETVAFLQQNTGLPLQAGDLSLVETRREGWAAGLRLLALALEGRDDMSEIGRIVERFMAGRRGISEYFVAEALNSQPAQIQLFLRMGLLRHARKPAAACRRALHRFGGETPYRLGAMLILLGIFTILLAAQRLDKLPTIAEAELAEG